MKDRTRKLVFAALMAALVFAGSSFRVTLPVAVAGTTSFHLGNIMCALSGLLLGPAWGAGAAGIGSMLYDWTNPLYVAESWITLLTKGAYGLVAGLVMWTGQRKGKVSYTRDLAGTAAGAVCYIILHLSKTFFYDGLLMHGLTASAAVVPVIGKIPADLFNGVLALVFAPVLAGAIRTALSRSGLSPDRNSAK